LGTVIIVLEKLGHLLIYKIQLEQETLMEKFSRRQVWYKGEVLFISHRKNNSLIDDFVSQMVGKGCIYTQLRKCDSVSMSGRH